MYAIFQRKGTSRPSNPAIKLLSGKTEPRAGEAHSVYFVPPPEFIQHDENWKLAKRLHNKKNKYFIK